MILLYPLGVDLYLVAVPAISATLGAVTGMANMAFAAYLLGMAVTVPAAGWLADRHGRRPVALSGCIVFMAASLWAATATTAVDFLGARLCQGAGAGTLYIMTFTVLRDTLKGDKLTVVLSVINGVICVVPVLAPLLGYLILSGMGWRAIFYTMAALSGGVWLLILTQLRESLVERNRSRFKPSSQFARWTLLSSAGFTCILGYINASPLILMQEMGLGSGSYSAVMMMMALLSMVASFANPWLIRHFGKRAMLSLAHAMFGLASSSLFISNWIALNAGWALVLAGFAMLCVAFSISFSIIMSEALSSCDYQAAQASAVLCVVQLAVAGTYIWLTGWWDIAPRLTLALAPAFAVLCFSWIAMTGARPRNRILQP